MAIAIAILHMARSFNLCIVAAGVETEAERNFFHQHGCDEIQGYWFSPLLPAAEFRQFLRHERCLRLPDSLRPA